VPKKVTEVLIRPRSISHASVKFARLGPIQLQTPCALIWRAGFDNATPIPDLSPHVDLFDPTFPP
jgi:hypothetical protein